MNDYGDPTDHLAELDRLRNAARSTYKKQGSGGSSNDTDDVDGRSGVVTK